MFMLKPTSKTFNLTTQQGGKPLIAIGNRPELAPEKATRRTVSYRSSAKSGKWKLSKLVERGHIKHTWHGYR